jgi:hypothetical protein
MDATGTMDSGPDAPIGKGDDGGQVIPDAGPFCVSILDASSHCAHTDAETYTYTDPITVCGTICGTLPPDASLIRVVVTAGQNTGNCFPYPLSNPLAVFPPSFPFTYSATISAGGTPDGAVGTFPCETSWQVSVWAQYAPAWTYIHCADPRQPPYSNLVICNGTFYGDGGFFTSDGS